MYTSPPASCLPRYRHRLGCGIAPIGCVYSMGLLCSVGSGLECSFGTNSSALGFGTKCMAFACEMPPKMQRKCIWCTVVHENAEMKSYQNKFTVSKMIIFIISLSNASGFLTNISGHMEGTILSIWVPNTEVHDHISRDICPWNQQHSQNFQKKDIICPWHG